MNDTELKVVLHMGSGGSRVGVQEKDTDPVVERLEVHSLEEALAAVPAVLQRARERWATSRRDPSYQRPSTPPPPPRPAPTAVRREERRPSQEGQMDRLI